ncbi:hypothetical protein V1505DRAFT_287942, partial [Lipomyces doorenjongii]
ERWMEFHVRKHANFGISTTPSPVTTISRVEGSHVALKAVLTSSSGTLFTAGNKINRRGLPQARTSNIIGSNENVIVKTAVRDQVQTSHLCTKISRSALDLLHAEVMKKFHNQEEAGSSEDCNCDICRRYLLPCSHQIRLGFSTDVQDIHPRCRISWSISPRHIPRPCHPGHVETLSRNAAAKGRPRGTRRLPKATEIVQRGADSVENVRRCRLCKRTGHNKRTC